MTQWSWWWIAWLAMFGILEALALVTHRWENTFSGHVWLWAAVKGNQDGKFAKLRRLALLFFVAWLAFHFLGGGVV